MSAGGGVRGTVNANVKLGQGGLIASLAQGGLMLTKSNHADMVKNMMSAQAGRLMTTRGPQLVLAGDNPGGKEDVAFIPQNNPGPTLGAIARRYGMGSGSGGGSSGGGGDIIIEIHEHKENGREEVRRFKAAMGQDRYRFGA